MKAISVTTASSFALLAGLAVSSPAFAEGERRLTMPDAIAIALDQHPDLALARETTASGKAKADSWRRHYGPSLHVDATGNIYREPYTLPFGTQVFTLYNQTVSFTHVTLSEPITGLGYLKVVVDAAEHEVAAANAELDRAKLDVAFRAAEAYIRVLEARAQADVAHRTVADIEAELGRAQQLRSAEAYTDIDVLRFRSAKAAAEQLSLRADTAAASSLAALVIQLGMHDGEPIDIVDDLPQTAPPPAGSLEEAQAKAIAARPELRSAKEKVAAADQSRKAAWAGYVPDVRAVAQWEHNTGVQPFQPKDAEFIGLHVSWNVWDWGAVHQQIVDAQHATARAQIAEHALADSIKLDVRKRWLEAKAAYDGLALAQTQQQTAEEAYRLQRVRFDNEAATTTDVLDADTDVAKARTASALARYEYYLAVIGLARAVGELPSR